MILVTDNIIDVENEGDYFTNGETILVPPVYLGKWDKAENWREITPEEKEALETEWEEENETTE